MEADLMTSTNFYFLNQNFEVIHKLTQYESLMWVDKYDEPGNFEIYAPPTAEIKEAAQVNNYFRSDKSEHLMIVEKLETTVSPDDGERLIISGRSLESILDRRVLFLKCYFRDKNSEATPSSSTTVGADNLEDAIRQLLEYLFISPVHWNNSTGTWVEAADRKVSNFVFQYTNEEEISSIVLKDCEFDKGENALNIVNKIVKQAGLGYKITLNSSNQFVFRLIKGVNRCTDQTSNPAVIFSTKFNNLKSSKFTDDFGENFRNFVYTEGETYKSQRPTIVETGEATGLLRREVYVTSSVQHETESSNVTHSGITKQKKKLTEEEYQAALAEDAEKYYKKYASKTTLESEIEPRLTFQYGRDFAIGDILEVQDGTGNTGKVRCVEFIISHSHSGYEEYPTFENYTEDDEEPAQTTASGGEYTDEGKKSSDEIIEEAVNLAITKDSKDMTVTFTSSDVTDANASSWTSVTKLTGGETHATLFSRISQMFKNIRYLYNRTKATNVTGYVTNTTVVQALTTFKQIGSMVIVSGILKFSNLSTSTYYNVITGAPKAISTVYLSVPNEYAFTGTATIQIITNSTTIQAKCSHANVYYYFELIYFT